MIKSVGILSDFIFYQKTSVITVKENYIKIESPNNPNYYWGNLLLFFTPPQKDDLVKWIDYFDLEFPDRNLIKHRTFLWDIYGDLPYLDPFLKAGFVLEESIFLKANSIAPSYFNNDVSYREITNETDFKKVIDLQLRIGIEDYNYVMTSYRDFIEKKFYDYKLMIDSGLGNWFGAFVGDELISDLGMFGDEKVKRFQSIETRKDYRKKGIAQNLMGHAAMIAHAESYILAATSSGPAIDMYMKIGFSIFEVVTGVCQYNRNLHPK